MLNKILTVLQKYNLAVGNFFFEYRNLLFPVIYLLIFLFVEPKLIFKSRFSELTVMWIGAGLAILGQAIRLFTIGFDYIERGGREGKVHASYLVHGGVYSCTRNPMYIGNVLIAAGLAIFSGTINVMLIVIPVFLFIYQSIIVAEEYFLLNKFGDEFRDYCSRVNRIIPNFKGIKQTFSGVKFDWRKSLRKEYGTVFFLILSFLIIHHWHEVQIFGQEYFRKRYGLLFLWIFIISLIGYISVRILKKTGRLKSPS